MIELNAIRIRGPENNMAVVNETIRDLKLSPLHASQLDEAGIAEGKLVKMPATHNRTIHAAPAGGRGVSFSPDKAPLPSPGSENSDNSVEDNPLATLITQIPRPH